MSFYQELSSWSPFLSNVASQPVPVGSLAPEVPQIIFPRADGRPVIVTFLRHCGCPFAEKTFALLRRFAEEHQSVHCIAVSHSDESATSRWTDAVGGSSRVELIVDHERTAYGKYGLGLSSFWHVLNPWSMSSVFRLGKQENIWNRPTESGSRWQTSGTFAVDAQGIVKYAKPAEAADNIGDFELALKSLI